MRALGIDISSHNGKWNPSVMDKRIKLVIQKATEGTTFQDSTYKKNRNKCPDNIVWAAYHLLRETSALDTQIDNFLVTAQLNEGDIAALDLETRWLKAMVKKWGLEQTKSNINTWLTTVGNTLNRKPLIYISGRGVKVLGYDLNSFRSNFPIWWVEYKSDKHAPWSALNNVLDPKYSEWDLWQITSSGNPKLAGVESSSVDLNIIRDSSFLQNKTQWIYDPELDFFLPPE